MSERQHRSSLDPASWLVTFLCGSSTAKLSLLLHRRLVLTALVAPGTFLPGVHGVIAAEVAPGSESRGRRWWCARGCCDHMDSRQQEQPHRVHSSSFLAPALLHSYCLPFHSSTWMSQLMLSHSGIALLLSLWRFCRCLVAF